MNARKLYFIPCLLLISTRLFCQSDSIKKHKLIKFYSVNINLGPQYSLKNMSFSEFKNSGIQHSFLEKDYSGFNALAPIAAYKPNAGTHFCLGGNFVLYNKKQQKYNSKNEFGLKVFITSLSSTYFEFEKVNTEPFDTLYAQNSLQQYYVTKKTHEKYELTYKSSAVLLALGYKRYLNNQLKSWNAYGGINFGFGKTFGNYLNTYHTLYDIYVNQYNYEYYSEYDNVSASLPKDAYDIKIRSSYIQKAEASIGVQYRLRLRKSKQMDVTAFGLEVLGGAFNIQQPNKSYYQNYYYAITANVKFYFRREFYN